MFSKETNVIARLNSIPPEHLVRVSTITLGEIEAGLLMTKTTDETKRNEFRAFVYKEFLPYAIEVSGATRIYYAKIIGRIWKKHPPPPKRETERHLVELGVDINDVWTAAVAFEHGLVFVTDDKMARIKEALSSDVMFENWR